MMTIEAPLFRADPLMDVDGVYVMRALVKLPQGVGRKTFIACVHLEGDHAVVASRLHERGDEVLLVIVGTCWPAQEDEPWDVWLTPSMIGVSLSDPSWDGAGTQGSLEILDDE